MYPGKLEGKSDQTVIIVGDFNMLSKTGKNRYRVFEGHL